jgi:hypothetical protein
MPIDQILINLIRYICVWFQSNDVNSTSSADSDEEDNKSEKLGAVEINCIRRSWRLQQTNEDAYFLHSSKGFIEQTIEGCEHVFSSLEEGAKLEDVDITSYLPEPKNLCQIEQCHPKIKEDWIKAVCKEVKFLIENETFKRGETPNSSDEIIPAICVFKAKVTSCGYLDKLKARCVAHGDLQKKSDPVDVWAPCMFARTFKVFECQAVKHGWTIKQLDFIENPVMSRFYWKWMRIW